MIDKAHAASTHPQQPTSADPAKPKKRAVVLIHGIGSQSPMETLRPFVEAVWTSLSKPGDPPPKHRTWSLRDQRSENLELWRITTDEDAQNVRTDFFEFYWADMMEDTRLSSVGPWILHLFWRRLVRVPTAMVQMWVAGWIAAVVAVAFFALFYLLGRAVSSSDFGGAAWGIVATAAAGFLAYVKSDVLIAVVGDAPRYLVPTPSNVGARTRIRLAGLKLLKSLHCDDEYDRIIVAAHSLGTVVGYDLLNFYWSEISDTIHHNPNDPALSALEQAGHDVRLDPVGKIGAFQKAQRAYFEDIRATAPPGTWKISDFVTMGSPLTYAHLLLVDDSKTLMPSEQHAIDAGWLQPWWSRLDAKTKEIAALFRARAAQRELPLCPPVTETGDSFVYAPGAGGFVVPHNAAVFASVRWTNIFAPCRAVFKGDVVGGPVGPICGPGVRDVPLTGAVGKMWAAHTHYWDRDRDDTEHLDVLRRALDFADVDRPPA